MRRVFLLAVFILASLVSLPSLKAREAGGGNTGELREAGEGYPGDTRVAGGNHSATRDTMGTPVRASLGGYATWLYMAMFEKPEELWTNSSMLHNRLNFKAYPGRRFTIALEVRNRFVTGDMVNLDPSYIPGLAADPGLADMSWNLSGGSSYVLNTMVDRAYIDFTAGRFLITAGRQRINWSQALVWNPNDIFNTYSFFDFDYVERPGSDALKVTYSTGPASAAEAVVKMDGENRTTAAALFRFNLLNTDFQFLAGETDEEFFTAGMGWSGALGPYSIRGEGTLFHPFDNSVEEKSTLIVTAGVDRAFSDKITALAQVMYSNNPLSPGSFIDLYQGGLTARELAFSEFSAIGQFTYSPIPLLSISLSAIWYPDLDGFYAGPAIDFSLAENVDFTFLWQHFSSLINTEKTRMNLGFIRIRYSF